MSAQSRLYKYLVLLLVPILLLVSCASSAAEAPREGYGGGASNDAYQEEMSAESLAPVSYSAADQTAASRTERMVIKNASLSIAVDDPSAVMDRISSMAEEMGGFVVSANMYETRLEDGQKAPEGSITIRVPAERLQEAISRIKAETSLPVIGENISSQDVTSEYTDLDSRVRNLEAAEKQLQNILDRATTTKDVLDIFNKLTEVREQIEVLKGQMKYYEQSAALSAITVELVPNVAVQPVTVGGWQPQGIARDALQALINTLKGLATAAIWLGIYVLPIFGPPVLLIYFIQRWLRRRQKPTVAPPPEQPPAV